MLLKKILRDTKRINTIGDDNIEIYCLTIKSAQITNCGLYFAIKGNRYDGNDYINDAVRNGARAIITDNPNTQGIDNATVIIVKNARKAMAECAKVFYNCPDNAMTIIAITGTNGKTTTSFMIRDILNFYKKRVGVIGTIGYYINDIYMGEGLTTPDPIELFKILKCMKDLRVEYVVMEASAHALALHKLHSLNIDIAIFTNLTHDHQDFFKSIKSYKKAKTMLFKKKTDYNIINVDDPTGREIITMLKGRSLNYGIYNPSDVFAININHNNEGSSFLLNLCDLLYDISTTFYGEYNIYNLLAACSLIKCLNFNTNRIIDAVGRIKQIEGRFNVIPYKDNLIVIDYAHTPDGLQNLLKGVKIFSKKEIIVVFGCGGDRDRAKRPIMGQIADSMCDTIILTADNSRYEITENIICEIEKGIISKQKQKIIIDREKAIKYALSIAHNSVIVIAGKGAEKYISFMGHDKPFNDKEVVLRLTKEDL